MLYKLNSNNGIFDNIEPVGFTDFSNFGNLERNLENLIAENILETLFEHERLMPIFQERPYQPEADIYALNEYGDLVIFELKRSTAGVGAMQQLLGYAQDAGQWKYKTLQEKYRTYIASEEADLKRDHKENFGELERELDEWQFNLRQRLVLLGSAADQSLLKAVKYWKQQGLSIDFVPYRVYELGESNYFEFFALPYDEHTNPAERKGVLFNTFDGDSMWDMLQNQYVAAYGDAQKYVSRVNPNDIVFFVLRGEGIVAAATAIGDIFSPDPQTSCRPVQFLTQVPNRNNEEVPPAMPFEMVRRITGRNFFWARTIIVPYLSNEEAENLVNELMNYLD